MITRLALKAVIISAIILNSTREFHDSAKILAEHVLIPLLFYPHQSLDKYRTQKAF